MNRAEFRMWGAMERQRYQPTLPHAVPRSRRSRAERAQFWFTRLVFPAGVIAALVYALLRLAGAF